MRPKVSTGDGSSLAGCPPSCAVRVSAIGKLPCVVHDNDEDEEMIMQEETPSQMVLYLGWMGWG